MKLSRNALTFLNRAYRSIFKRAFLASLVVVSATGFVAQASGDVQNGDSEDPMVQAGFDKGHTLGNTEGFTDATITGELTHIGGSVNKYESDAYFAQKVTMKSGSKFTISDATGDSGTAQVYVKDTFSVEDGATLKLQTSNGKNGGLLGVIDYADNDRVADGEDWDLTKSHFVAKSGSTVEVSGSVAVQFSNVDLDGTVNVSGAGGIGAIVNNAEKYPELGVLNINGATLNINAGSGAWIGGHEVNLDSAKVTFSSDKAETYTDISHIYAYQKGTVNINDKTEITVNSGKAGLIYADYVNINGGTITSLGDLYLGKEVSTKANSDNVADTITMTGGKLTNYKESTAGRITVVGTLNQNGGVIDLKGGSLVGSATYKADQIAEKFVGDLVTSAGDLKVNAAYVDMGNVTLGGLSVVSVSGAIGGKDTWDNNAMIGAEDKLTIEGGAEIALGESSQLFGETVDIKGGTITFDGSGSAVEGPKGQTASKSSKSSFIRAFDSGSINMTAGTLIVNPNKFAGLYGAKINLNGGTINNNGTLILDRDLKQAAQAETSTTTSATESKVTIGDVTINNSGTIKLNKNTKTDIVSQNLVLDGILENSGSLSVSGKLTFNGDIPRTLRPKLQPF